VGAQLRQRRQSRAAGLITNGGQAGSHENSGADVTSDVTDIEAGEPMLSRIGRKTVRLCVRINQTDVTLDVTVLDYPARITGQTGGHSQRSRRRPCDT